MTLKVIRQLQAFSSAIRGTFVQHFTRFQLTACLRGPSATAGLLVFTSVKLLIWLWVSYLHFIKTNLKAICNIVHSSTNYISLTTAAQVVHFVFFLIIFLYWFINDSIPFYYIVFRPNCL